MSQVKAYAAHDPESTLEPFKVNRREILPNDVEVEIGCGVCHSDLHIMRNDWGGSRYPVVPGHEIIGRITKTGKKVTGDLVGVGCMVDSCQNCDSGKEGLEQYCENGATMTYNGKDKNLGGHTFGGCTENILFDQKFVCAFLRILMPKLLHLFSVQELRPGRHCGIGKLKKEIKWV